MSSDEQVHEARYVHERLCAIARQRSALDAQELALLHDAKRLQLWREHGYATLYEYLEHVLAYQPRTIQERLRVSDALQDLPALADALTDATLTFSAVRELTRVATPQTVDRWIERASGLCVREIEELVSGHKYGDDPDDPKDEKLRRCRLSFEDILPDTVALGRQVRLVANTDAERNLDDNELLQAVFRCFLAEGASGSRTRAANQISITTCRQCKRFWQNGAGRMIEVDRATFEQARCDAEDLGALDAASPARKTSSVTPRMREQVFARDGDRCAVPGCRAARNLQIHHIRYQSHGGSHDLSNIVLLCTGHHRLHHLGRLDISGQAPDRLVITRRFSPCNPLDVEDVDDVDE